MQRYKFLLISTDFNYFIGMLSPYLVHKDYW